MDAVCAVYTVPGFQADVIHRQELILHLHGWNIRSHYVMYAWTLHRFSGLLPFFFLKSESCLDIDGHFFDKIFGQISHTAFGRDSRSKKKDIYIYKRRFCEKYIYTVYPYLYLNNNKSRAGLNNKNFGMLFIYITYICVTILCVLLFCYHKYIWLLSLQI